MDTVLQHDQFRIINHSKSTTCSLCVSKLGDGIKKQMNSRRSAYMLYKYKLLMHPQFEKLCTNCNKLSLEELKPSEEAKVEIIDIKTDYNFTFSTTLCRIVNSRWFRRLLKGAFIVKKKPAKPRTFHVDNISDKHCASLVNVTKAQIHEISEHIYKEMVLHGYRWKQITDFCSKDGVAWKRTFVDIDPKQCSHSDGAMALILPKPKRKCLKSIKNSIFYFLIKSKGKLSYVMMGIYHEYDESHIRALFHQGRILMSTFFTPWHFGINHLTRTELETKQSNRSFLIETIVGKKVVALLDSTKLKQTRFFHYNSDYNNYDPSKKRPMRGYVGIDTTSGYSVDFIGGNCTHGKSGDSHLFNWITRTNARGFVNLFDYTKDLLAVDRGYKFCIGTNPFWLLLPALSSKHPGTLSIFYKLMLRVSLHIIYVVLNYTW